MTYSISTRHLLICSSLLIQLSCGSSKSSDNKASDPLVPQGFRSTVPAASFSSKQAELNALFAQTEQNFGVSLHGRDTENNPSIMALQAFAGTKASASLLKQSLQIETAVTVLTRLVTEKPDSCAAAVLALETFYAAATVSLANNFEQMDRDQLARQAAASGMKLEDAPTDPTQSLAFHLTGSGQLAGHAIEQKLDLSAGAYDSFIYFKRDLSVTTDLTHAAAQAGNAVHSFRLNASGGMAADLVQQSLTLIDKKQATLQMQREGNGMQGSGAYDLQSYILGGTQPSISTNLSLQMQGEGLVDEQGIPFYNEQHQVTSKLAKLDANTLDFTLNLQSLARDGSKQLGVHWVLQKTTNGKCELKQVRI